MDSQTPTNNSSSYIKVWCSNDADPKLNRLQLNSNLPTYIELQPGLNILTVEDYPDLKRGFFQVDDEDGNWDSENGHDITEFDFSNFDGSEMVSMSHMFAWMAGVKKITFGNMATPVLNDTDCTFYRTGENVKMDMLDLRGLNFSKVTNSYCMFHGIKTAEINLTDADFSNLTNAECMFDECEIDHLILNYAKFPVDLLEQIFKELKGCSEIKKISLKGWEKKEIMMIIDSIENQFIQCRHHTSGIVYEFDTNLDFSSLQPKNRLNRISEQTPPIYENQFIGSSRQFYHPTYTYTQMYSMFDGTILDWLDGAIKNDIPTLPIGSLIYQLSIIQRNLYNEAALKILDGNSLKPILWVDEVLPRIQVFLVTTQSEGKLNHGVYSLFEQSNVTVSEKIPSPSKNVEEETSPERLGCYIPTNGTIYLWVDRIAEHKNPTLVFQKVLLHELIHLFFDVIRKSIKNTPVPVLDEETLDNYLVLFCYTHSTSIPPCLKNTYTQDIRELIIHQPQRYRDALDMFNNESEWVHVKKNIYKIFLPQN